MTNDEAIYTLKNAAWLGWDKQKEKVTEAVRMAVEALKRETSGDAISRHGAIDHFKSIADATSMGNKYNEGFVDGLNFAVGHLETMPSVQPTYTDTEIQKMQDMEQAQLDKAFELGKEEIIRCKDCKYWQDQEVGIVEVPICARPQNKYEKFPLVMLIDGDEFCSYAERRNDGSD